ncbi:hypothetical protein B4U78_015745 [Microbacterium esteraromaticum]|nr:hypothetical protein B4U78_015745 [Microbacterium esteraromaticum]
MDLNLSQQDNVADRKVEQGGISLGEMEEPKLFFAAFDFMDKEIGGKNHFVDFAVLEVNFKNEEVAKKVTNNFANKERYKNGSKDVINVFSPPIEKKYETKGEEEL